MLTSFRALFLVLILLIPSARADWERSGFGRLYREGHLAQNRLTYDQWIAGLARDEAIKETIRAEIGSELELIRALGQGDRQKELQNIIRYYSEAHRTFLPSAVQWEKSIGYDWNELVAGQYDSQELANRLVRTMRRYDRGVVDPLLAQIEAELVRDFPRANFLCLGRDFTAGYLYFKWRGNLPADHLFTLNISRKIKDLVEGGQYKPMRELLYGIGLTKDRLLRDGLVFLDSSKAGKIPRAVMKALVDDMTEAEATQFLGKVAIRYAASSVSRGSDFRGHYQAALNGGGQLTRQQIKKLLDTQWSIPVFKLRLPDSQRGRDESDNHHFFEHRPKFMMTAETFGRDGHLPTLAGPTPSRPSEKINSLLGLYSDLKFHDSLHGDDGEEKPARAKPQPQAPAQKPEPRAPAQLAREPWLNDILTSISNAARDGHKGIKKWQDAGIRGADADLKQFQLIQTGDRQFPWELRTPHRNFRLRHVIGEGNNVTVYLTESWTALKVLKAPQNATKQFLQCWMYDELTRRGVHCAAPLWISPTGTLLEQEYVPSDSIDAMYGNRQVAFPRELKAQVLDARQKAQALLAETGIHLDLKGGNFHVRDGRVTFVDYTPRLNSGRWHYYFDRDGGRPLTDDEFLDRFLYYEVERGRGQKPAYRKCQELLEKYGNGRKEFP